MLRTWKDAALSDLVSIGGTFDNPLQELDINGDTGETRVGDFYVAISQAELAADITTVEQTSVTLNQPMEIDVNYPVILVGTEKMLVTDGFATVNLTVTRGHNLTTPALHTTGDTVYSAYNATEITITTVDVITPPDESSWVDYRHYGTGTYEHPHAIEDIAYNANVRIQYQAVIPEWPSQYKIDLKPRLSFKLAEIPNP